MTEVVGLRTQRYVFRFRNRNEFEVNLVDLNLSNACRKRQKERAGGGFGKLTSYTN